MCVCGEGRDIFAPPFGSVGNRRAGPLFTAAAPLALCRMLNLARHYSLHSNTATVVSPQEKPQNFISRAILSNQPFKNLGISFFGFPTWSSSRVLCVNFSSGRLLFPFSSHPREVEYINRMEHLPAMQIEPGGARGSPHPS